MKFSSSRVVRFVGKVAWECLPEIFTKPVNIGFHFYECFVVADARQQNLLLAEARRLERGGAESLADELLAAMHAEGQPVPAAARATLLHFIQALREAADQNKQDAAEALRQALNKHLLAPSGSEIRRRELSGAQKSVGRLVASCVLAGHSPGRPTPLPGDAPAVPGYQVMRLLGEGGFSRVFLARHEATGELRAVKVIHQLDDPRRLRREIEVLRRVRHDHLVKYLDHGEAAGLPWIAMEYLGEYSLADLLANPESRPNPEQALLLGEQVLSGLAALHAAPAAPIVHRDLKPANVMVDPAFRLRVIDFGLARPLHPAGGSQTGVTQRGDVIGTPHYMSPEQVVGEEGVGCAADVWSFGAILYEMLTGGLLFPGRNAAVVWGDIRYRDIALDHDAIPPEVRPFLAECLRREAGQRLPDAAAALRQFQGLSASARRRLRHERYRATWIPVLENQYLEKFAAHLKGQMPGDAVALFCRSAAKQGVADLDEERLAEVLPAVFAQQAKAEAVAAELQQAKKRLQHDIPRLAAGEIVSRSNEVKGLEERKEAAARAVTAAVRRLLADEVANWEQVQEREAKRRAVEERLRWEAERQEAERLAEEERREAERRAEEARLRKEQERLEAERLAEAERKRKEQERLEAEQRARDLQAQEEADWREAHEGGGRTLRGYRRYLSRWPDGRYKEPARAEVERFKAADRARQKVVLLYSVSILIAAVIVTVVLEVCAAYDPTLWAVALLVPVFTLVQMSTYRLPKHSGRKKVRTALGVGMGVVFVFYLCCGIADWLGTAVGPARLVVGIVVGAATGVGAAALIHTKTSFDDDD